MSSSQPLAPLFEADRLAIIGASDRNHYAVNISKNLQNMGFDLSKIIPINPGRPEVSASKPIRASLMCPATCRSPSRHRD